VTCVLVRILINGCFNYEGAERGMRQGIEIPCKCDPVSFCATRRPLVNPFFPPPRRQENVRESSFGKENSSTSREMRGERGRTEGERGITEGGRSPSDVKTEDILFMNMYARKADFQRDLTRNQR